MITYIRFRVIQSEIDQFLKHYAKGVRDLNNLQRYESCELSQCESEKENFILRICWKSNSKVSLMSKDTIILQGFLNDLNGYKEDILEMRNYEVIDSFLNL